MILLNDIAVEIGNFPDGTMLIKQAAPRQIESTSSGTTRTTGSWPR